MAKVNLPEQENPRNGRSSRLGGQRQEPRVQPTKEMQSTLQGCLGMNGDEQERRAKELHWEQEHSRLLSVQ